MIFEIITNRNKLIFFNSPKHQLKKFKFEKDILKPEINLLFYPKILSTDKLISNEYL